MGEKTPLTELFDAINLAIEALDRAAISPSREKALVKTKLDEAYLWARELGVPQPESSPYVGPQGGRFA